MRKLVALALAGALFVGTAVPAFAGENRERAEKNKTRFESQFADWSADFWGNESLARMVTKGVIKGNSNGTIAAGRPVTRLEAAIMLARLLNLEAPKVPQGEFEVQAPWGKIKIENEHDEFEIKIRTREGEFAFEDSGSTPSWGRDAILVGLQHGFLLFDGARMSPLAPLNRLEAAIMLVKAAGLDEEAKAQAGATLTFSDADKISQRLRGYIAIAAEKGFVTGYEDGSFKPQKLVSRAEWAALLDRLDRKGPAVSVDGRQVKGGVTAVTVGTVPSITMTTPVFPGGVTYPVDETAVFYEKGKSITIADVKAGDQVIVNLSDDRKILMVTVHNVPRHMVGAISAYTAPTSSTAGSITLTVAGAASTYPVTVATAVALGDKPGTLADVRVGDLVSVTLEGAELTRIHIKVATLTVKAQLTAVTPGVNNALPTLTVSTENGPAATFTVADSATIKGVDGSALTLADLKNGDRVKLTVERNMVHSIRVTEAAAVQPPQAVTATGSITSIGAPVGGSAIGYSVAIQSSGAITVFTFGTGAALSLGDAAMVPADLKVGDQVEFTYTGTVISHMKVTARNP